MRQVSMNKICTLKKETMKKQEKHNIWIKYFHMCTMKLSSLLSLRRDFLEVIFVELIFSKQKLLKFNCVER